MNKKSVKDIIVIALAVWGVILTLYEIGMKVLVYLNEKGLLFNNDEFEPDDEYYDDEEDEISDEDFFNL